MGLILAGTLGMLQRKPRERASSGWGWLPWAVLSAVCASLTSILGKVGMTGVDSYVGTAIRNMVVLAMAWALVLGLGLQREIPALSRKNWGFWLCPACLPGCPGCFTTGRSRRGRPALWPHRQAEHSGDGWLFLPGAP